MPLDYDGKPIEISFDPKFLLEMLRVLEPETQIALEMVDSSSPALFRCDANYQYVVVPLVVKE
jgi:DNA polymerase-3 subunit beta